MYTVMYTSLNRSAIYIWIWMSDVDSKGEGSLLCGRAALRETFETLEGVVDEHPVLVGDLAVLRDRRRR